MPHSYTNLLVHGVFSTKDRQPLIADDLRSRLYEYMVGLARGEFGDVLCVGGTADHLHGLLVVRADVAVSHAMSRWKSLSSAWMKGQGVKKFAWQQGYAAFSVSRSSADRVSRYIEGQVEHHRRMSFQEELVALLERHGIAYDPERLLA